MVKVQHLFAVLFTIFIFTTIVSNVAGQRQYHLEHEWAEIWINEEDGTIDLLYDINITLDSGDDISYILVGQPKGDFTIGTAIDQSDHILTTTTLSAITINQIVLLKFLPKYFLHLINRLIPCISPYMLIAILRNAFKQRFIL